MVIQRYNNIKILCVLEIREKFYDIVIVQALEMSAKYQLPKQK